MNIEKYLIRVGIKPHLKGFYFLSDAIDLVMKDVKYLQKMTTRLYPFIAEKHDETPSKVERAMRHAIETSTLKRKPKPTNAQFISEHAIEIKSLRIGA